MEITLFIQIFESFESQKLVNTLQSNLPEQQLWERDHHSLYNCCNNCLSNVSNSLRQIITVLFFVVKMDWYKILGTYHLPLSLRAPNAMFVF